MCSAFDELIEKSGMWKLETVGDAYIAAGGLFDSHGASTTTRNRRETFSRAAALALRTQLDTAFKVALSMLVRRGPRNPG